MAHTKTKPKVPSVTDWEQLATIGDIRRMVRWAACALVAKRIDVRTAGVISVLANSLLGCLREDREQAIPAQLLTLQELLSFGEAEVIRKTTGAAHGSHYEESEE